MAKSSSGSGNWGISWADVKDAWREHEREHNCHLSAGVWLLQKNKASGVDLWVVAVYARSHPGRPEEMRGYGECDVGGSRGAASFPGAFLRAIMEACTELEKRRQSAQYDRDNPAPRLPGL